MIEISWDCNSCLWCAVAYVIWVISVRVLCLFHNNSDKLQLIYLLLVNAVQLVDTKLLLLPVDFYNSTTLQLFLHCTVKSLKYAPVTSIIGWQFPESGWVPVTFSGAPSLIYLTAWTVPCFGTVQDFLINGASNAVLFVTNDINDTEQLCDKPDGFLVITSCPQCQIDSYRPQCQIDSYRPQCQIDSYRPQCQIDSDHPAYWQSVLHSSKSRQLCQYLVMFTSIRIDSLSGVPSC